jgi:hypothetical protein
MGVDCYEKDLMDKTAHNKPSDWAHSSHLLAKEIFGQGGEETKLLPLQMLTLPTLPKDLSPTQAAQMEAFLQYLHIRLRHLISSVRSTPVLPDDSPAHTRISISARQWQNIIDLHAQISTLMSGQTSENDP